MTFDEFKSLAGNYNLIPLSSVVIADTLTPVSAYRRLRKGRRDSFLFESVEGGDRIARYSFIAFDPMVLLHSKNGSTWIEENGRRYESKENIFDLITKTLSRYRQAPLQSLPRFAGGLVGFIGYDEVRAIESLSCTVKNNADLPDSILGLFTSIVVFDHLKHQCIIVVNAVIGKAMHLGDLYKGAQSEMEEIQSILKADDPPLEIFETSTEGLIHETNLTDFKSAVCKAKQHIHEGDIFQIVLSQRFSTTFQGDIFNLYRSLRTINPSPYLYYLEFGDSKIIGSSPEILVRMEKGTAELYPIAGTRPRGETAAEDKALEKQLLSDPKEMAEHVMLVDLGRNDLGRVCQPGSVTVDRLMDVVKYSHVMHMASRIVGRVLPGATAVDVFKAAFPAGTVSGAPKVRAMQIIDGLEGIRRGIYAGGVGYFDFSGNMDFCIAIRTMFSQNGRLFLQAGAGIVADSDPEKEHREILAKAEALMAAMRLATEINQ